MASKNARRTLRFEVPDRASLEALVDGTPPGVDLGTQVESRAFREIYFDTPASDLKGKGATIRIRLDQDGSAALVLDLLEKRSADGAPQRRTARARVPAQDPATLFQGDTEPAQLLRALIDPARLAAVLEVEALQRTRTSATTDIAVHYNLAMVRCGELASEMHELEVELPAETSAAAEMFLGWLRDEHLLRPAFGETEGRIRELVERMETLTLERAVRAAREVAVLVHQPGAVALLERDGELIVPHAPGAGTQACRQALRAAYGHARARVRLLGTSMGTPGRPALEIWLAEDVADVDGDGVIWVPLAQALERAGAPGLRDARTLRALHVVARSGLGSSSFAALRARSEQSNAPQPLELVLQRLEAADGTAEPSPKEVPARMLLNMELSRMAFDERILVMAEDAETPLLARVRFLAMFGQRRDDFFMTRVSRFKRMLGAGDTERSMDGLTPSEQLDVIAVRSRQMMGRAYKLLGQRLIPELAAEGITIESWEDLSAEDHEYIRATYADRLEALVMPVAADPTHPFPHVRNLRPALAATVRMSGDRRGRFIAVELPGDLPRFVPLPGSSRFVPLEDVLKATLPELYPGLEVVRAHTFRVTRSANIDFDDDPHDMLETIAEKVARRPYQEVVRLEVERTMPPEMRLHLLRELQFDSEEYASSLGEQDVYTVDRIVDLAALEEIAALDRPELRFPPHDVRKPFPEDRDIFDLIAERERFVQFPDDSFADSVDRLLDAAADDDDVVAIKVTLYRTSRDSAIVAALRRARENGKDAVAMVELKASFDEQRNIEWARSLEQAGIRVVFSPPKFKVHAKVALVVRREGDTLRRYAYVGTGNLNGATAASYVDVGIFTADPVVTQEINTVFNLLTGYSTGAEIDQLLVSPFNMRRRFLRMIEREVEHVKAGRRGLIRAQLNGLADRRLIAALYQASQAGVEIDMMVREICALRPGVPGTSDNIRVTSLLGRFLQHARIFHFHNGGDDEYFIGSADWRPRNMRERVEIITPVRDPEHRARLNGILQETLHHPDTWVLQADGMYVRAGDVIGAVPAAATSEPEPTVDVAQGSRT